MVKVKVLGEITVADVKILEPFISYSGNPENGNYGEWYEYLKKIESMGLLELDIQYTVATARLSANQIFELEWEPTVSQNDTPVVAHAKRLFARMILLKHGETPEDKKITHHPV